MTIDASTFGVPLLIHSKERTITRILMLSLSGDKASYYVSEVKKLLVVKKKTLLSRKEVCM